MIVHTTEANSSSNIGFFSVGRTYHSTSGTMEAKRAYDTLMNNETLLTIVTQMYYYDYIVFNFTLPLPISL